MDNFRDDRPLRIAVMGFGHIGSCIGATLADRGMQVTGIDRDAALVASLDGGDCPFSEPGLADLLDAGRAAGRLSFTTGTSAVAEADVVVVTVDTPVDAEGRVVAGRLEAACDTLAPLLRDRVLVLLKSTVPPGHTRSVVLPRLESAGARLGTDFLLAYSPERLSEGAALDQLRTLPVVVGGCDAASTAAGSGFWAHALGTEVRECPSPEVAELVKLASNWWIDHTIAMANDLARLCDAYAVDVLDVVAGANTLPKGAGTVNILLPSVGVGGACLTKDPWMAAGAARGRGVHLSTVETARKVNDAMPEYAAKAILDGMTRIGRPAQGATVAVLGAAFKSGTGDLRATPVLPVVQHLRKAGAQVRVFDPLADPAAVRELFDAPPEAALEDAVDGADCVAVLAGHAPFRDLDFPALKERTAARCLLFDGRAYYPRAVVGRAEDAGFAFAGVGR